MTRDKWNEYSKKGNMFPDDIQMWINRKNMQRGLDINHHYGYTMVFNKLVNRIPFYKTAKSIKVSKYRDEVIYRVERKSG